MSKILYGYQPQNSAETHHVYVNGMHTSADAARAQSDQLATVLEVPVHSIHNDFDSPARDALHAVLGWIAPVWNVLLEPVTMTLARKIHAAVSSASARPIVIHAYSQGGLILHAALALVRLSKWRWNERQWISAVSSRVFGILYGAPRHISELLPGHVAFVGELDPVPLAAQLRSETGSAHVVTLRGVDHSFARYLQALSD